MATLSHQSSVTPLVKGTAAPKTLALLIFSVQSEGGGWSVTNLCWLLEPLISGSFVVFRAIERDEKRRWSKNGARNPSFASLLTPYTPDKRQGGCCNKASAFKGVGKAKGKGGPRASELPRQKPYTSYGGTAAEQSWHVFFFRGTNFLTKNAPKFYPKLLSLYLRVGPQKSRKIPSKFSAKCPSAGPINFLKESPTSFCRSADEK